MIKIDNNNKECKIKHTKQKTKITLFSKIINILYKKYVNFICLNNEFKV